MLTLHEKMNTLFPGIFNVVPGSNAWVFNKNYLSPHQKSI